MLENLGKPIATAVQTLMSLAKVPLMSRRPSPRVPRRDGSIVILGNGPSLRNTIDTQLDRLQRHTLMAVNFAANAPDFFTLRPGQYTLADPHFFEGIDSDPNVARLWESIASADWPMTLHVPWKYAAAAWRQLKGHPHVTVKVFNLTPLEGSAAVLRPLIKGGWGMPRPRNVLIPAIMNAMREGYGTIYLAGADHSWIHDLYVDDENFVVAVQQHFYPSNEDERKRLRAAYTGVHLHEVLGSLAVALKSYWDIKEYARPQGVTIVNVTPGSLIDAFDRGTL